MYTYVHMETRGEHGYLFSVTVHLIIFEDRVSLNMELTNC